MSTDVVTDEDAFDALTKVEMEGWGWPPPSADARRDEWASLRTGLEASSEYALLAMIDGTPASAARCVLRTSVVRLFGAVTLAPFRGRGLYSALVNDRCKLGHAHGATLALTKARQTTSAPILERLGFRSYGSEESWRLPLHEC